MSSSKKILLVHLISNGDCLYATAIARQIKNDYPGCHLTWAIASSCKAIIDNNPYIDTIWEIPNVTKANCNKILRQLKKEGRQKKKSGVYDEVFFTHMIDTEVANYDGCIRSGVFRGYGKPITVPVTPVLRLRDQELEKVKDFAIKYRLRDFKNIILFEFAPQSGQAALTPEIAIHIAQSIVQNENTVVILSSNIKVGDNYDKIIDGSTLTIRETAGLTHYCTLLLGCSSGITWASTSDAAKLLPMVQILDPYVNFVNSVSRDFERFGLPVENVIELYDNNTNKIISCVNDVLNKSFSEARKLYYTPMPLHFITTRKNMYNLICFLQFGAIIKHIRVNVSVYGWNPLFFKEVLLAFIDAPFRLVYNVLKKNLMKKKPTTNFKVYL